MFEYEKYGIEVGQVYARADGSNGTLTVLDVVDFKECGDVVVLCSIRETTSRIDCFKLAKVRYYLT